MGIIEIIVIAVAMAMDCFAVALAAGASVKKIGVWNMVKMAVLFGGAQSVMCFLGWQLGSVFVFYIESYAHWAAFIILVFLGLKMIKEGFENDHEEEKDYFDNKIIFLLAIATSIDALAAGVGFSVLKIPVLNPIAAIGGASFLFTFLGIGLGKKAGDLLGRRAEIFGGAVLISIGIKTVIGG